MNEKISTFTKVSVSSSREFFQIKSKTNFYQNTIKIKLSKASSEVRYASVRVGLRAKKNSGEKKSFSPVAKKFSLRDQYY